MPSYPTAGVGPGRQHHSSRSSGSRRAARTHASQLPPLLDDEDYPNGGRGGSPMGLWMSLMGGLWGVVEGGVVIYLGVLCLVGLVTLLATLNVLVRPFSATLYRRLAAQLGASSFLDAMALLMPNMTLYLTGDSDVPNPIGTSVLVCNHLMDGDWWAILMLGRCVGLRGSIKVFLRKEVMGGGSFSSSSTVHPPSPSVGVPALPTVSFANTNNANVKSTTASASSPAASSPSKSKSTTSVPSSGPHGRSTTVSPQIALMGHLLHTLLEFPLLSSENNKDYITDRDSLFQLLRSFASSGATVPVHLLLFPEGWSLQCNMNNGSVGSAREARKRALAKSVAFAKRENRPQLKHLLLPKTTGFSASLESLRESNPVVYDITMAYRGYDGTVPLALNLGSLPTLWKIIRGHVAKEIHIRIKKYSMDEVLQDASWLDNQWAEKDRLLSHFARHQTFPTTDNRGFCRHVVFETRFHNGLLESSLFGLAKLGCLPFLIPILLLLSIPLFWAALWAWLLYRAICTVLPTLSPGSESSYPTSGGGVGVGGGVGGGGVGGGGMGGASGGNGGGNGTAPRETPSGGVGGGGGRRDDDDDNSANGGTDSVDVGTPFFPATPFGSPSISSTWKSSMDGMDLKDSTRR